MKILYLYSGAGLAAIGYMQAGFHVTGVDIEKKSCYAGNTWIEGDAIDILKDIDFCRKFDAIHASPPCQRYSRSTAPFRANGKEYADLIEPTRALLNEIGRPYVIENVPTAPVRPDIIVYGWMFGLKVIRRRHFELDGWFMFQPGISQCTGSVRDGDFITIIGKQ
jgi:DNA (cytosine-5)-methyltransferase 1